MYRKRSSILSIKSISPSFFQVIPSSNPSSPSSFPKYAVKTSPLIHSLWRRRFNVSAQRSDFLPDSDANGSYQQDPSGSDGGNPTNLQQNPTGWYPDGHNDRNLRTSEDGVYTKISDTYSNPNRSYQQNPYRSDRGNLTNLQQSPVAYPNCQFNQMNKENNLGANGDGIYRERSDFLPYLDSSGSYKQNPYGYDGRGSINLQRNPVGHPNAQFNPTYNSQNFGANERSDFPTEFWNKSSCPEEMQQSNSQGFYRGNQSRYGVGAQFNQMNNGQNYRRRSDLSPYSEPDAFYCQGQAGRNSKNLQQNQIGYQKFPIQNSVEEFQRHASIGGQFSQVNNGHGQNLGSSKNTMHGKRSEILPSSDSNASYYQKKSIINSANLHQVPNGYQTNNFGKVQKGNANDYYWENPNGQGITDQFNWRNNDQELETKSNRGDGEYPYDNESGFFRVINKELNQNSDEPFKGGINKKLNQDLDGPYEVDPEQFCHENSHGHGKRDPISNEDRNLSEPPLISSEVITFEDNLYKFDEFCNVGKVKEAIAVLAALEKIGMAIDIPRYLMLIEACGKEKCLENAQLIHDHLEWTVREVEVRVHNKILDMYSKCGLMDDAYQLFEKMPQRNITSWETMISGLANNGLGEEAIDLFTQFKEMGLKPDGGLFAAVFYTCGVLGAVDQGMLYFNSMKVDYGIAPLMEHYISIVDMFGRSGHLDEALEFVEMMPIEPNIDVWETLMNFCWVNGYIELGDRCAEIVEQHDSSRLTEQAKKGLLPVKTLELIKENEIKQNCDELNVKHYMHEFIAGRPENNMLYEQIRCLAQQMKEAGYVPDIACTLHDVDPENREEALMYHSERLAIVHGLMTSPARRPIRVIKNLRVCRDCHAVMKIISKLTGRLIIARDTKRFHHVENGVCSCNDFW